MKIKTCKLEYMIKNIDILPRKRLVFLFDKDSYYDFHEYEIEKLEEFKKREPVYGDSKDYKVWSYKCAKRSDEELRKKFEGIFTEINQICMDNHTYPIFEDPSNIEECLKIRKDLLRVYDGEEELNKFFGVERFFDYEPPRYKKTISYPAIFQEDKEDGCGWNVTVPDIFGGVTCGENYEDAVEMAKDMIKLMLKEAPGQCFPPKSFEETKNNFPDELVVMIEVEL